MPARHDRRTPRHDQRRRQGIRHERGHAAAGAALLLPDGYTAAMPALDAMPAEVSGLIRELRQHPTAAFVQRLYSTGFAAARRSAA